MSLEPDGVKFHTSIIWSNTILSLQYLMFPSFIFVKSYILLLIESSILLLIWKTRDD